MTDEEKSQWLAGCSPEFQAQIRAEQSAAREVESAQKKWEMESIASAEANERIMRALWVTIRWLAALATITAIIYGIVKFVKWAWYN